MTYIIESCAMVSVKAFKDVQYDTKNDHYYPMISFMFEGVFLKFSL